MSLLGMALPFTAGADAQNTGPNLGPDQNPSATHDGAPSGLTFAADLPSVAVPGGTPYQTGGFAPQATNPALPSDPMAGYTTTPVGIRK